MADETKGVHPFSQVGGGVHDSLDTASFKSLCRREILAMRPSKPVGRRSVLRSGLAAAIGAALPLRVRQTLAGDLLRLEPRLGTASFFGDGGPQTRV